MYDPVIGRWLSIDPEGQYYSPYVGMGNNPITRIDPNGGYSKFGAWWRSGFSSDIYKSGGEWGFNTIEKTNVGVVIQWNDGVSRKLTPAFKRWLEFEAKLGAIDRWFGKGGGGFVYYSTDPTNRDVFQLGRKPNGTQQSLNDPLSVLNFPGKSVENIYDRVQSLNSAWESGSAAVEKIQEGVKPKLQPQSDTISGRTVLHKNGKIFRIDTAISENGKTAIQTEIDWSGNKIGKPSIIK